MFSEAKKYHGDARECLRLAEKAESPEIRQKLLELSRVEREVLNRRQLRKHMEPERSELVEIPRPVHSS
jgi:hypothetical protein